MDLCNIYSSHFLHTTLEMINLWCNHIQERRERMARIWHFHTGRFKRRSLANHIMVFVQNGGCYHGFKRRGESYVCVGQVNPIFQQCFSCKITDKWERLDLEKVGCI